MNFFLSSLKIFELFTLKLKNLCELLNDEKCIAVGEVGLDYYGDEKNETGKNLQKEWFEGYKFKSKYELLPEYRSY